METDSSSEHDEGTPKEPYILTLKQSKFSEVSIEAVKDLLNFELSFSDGIQTYDSNLNLYKLYDPLDDSFKCLLDDLKNISSTSSFDLTETRIDSKIHHGNGTDLSQFMICKKKVPNYIRILRITESLKVCSRVS
jgi:hypothetical protein